MRTGQDDVGDYNNDGGGKTRKNTSDCMEIGIESLYSFKLLDYYNVSSCSILLSHSIYAGHNFFFMEFYLLFLHKTHILAHKKKSWVYFIFL